MTDTIHNVGDVIGGRYRIEGFVGQGGMQEVYRATDTLLHRLVALKAPKNSSAKKRFHRSAQMSARVNHINVAKTLDYLEDDKRAYLVEELIDGEDLRVILTNFFSYLDPYLVSHLLHHLARGLAASHHADVCHRDIKPNNIMIVGGAMCAGVKITDFGIAKMAGAEIDEAVEGGEGSLSASKTAIGALPYMAPETLDNDTYGKPDKPADIWALGAIVYELICGIKPFGDGFKAIPVILSGKFPSLFSHFGIKAQFEPLTKQLEEIVKSCLVLDQTKRPTADDLVKKCEELCYSMTPREFGTLKRRNNAYWGFIAPEKLSKDVFFHKDSIYGDDSVAVGDRLFFSRADGGGADRAFPLLKVKKPAKPTVF